MKEWKKCQDCNEMIYGDNRKKYCENCKIKSKKKSYKKWQLSDKGKKTIKNWVNNNYEKYKVGQDKFKKKNPEKIKKYVQDWRDRNPEKYKKLQSEYSKRPDRKRKAKIRDKTRYDLNIKDFFCMMCNRQAEEFHHFTYDKHFKVNTVALCHDCHRSIHKD